MLCINNPYPFHEVITVSKLFIGIISFILISVSSINVASAKNYPCSGSKGGIAYCENGKFVCNDGTKSKSKKICKGYEKSSQSNRTASDSTKKKNNKESGKKTKVTKKNTDN